MADYVHLLQHVSKSNFQKISYFRVIIESVFFAFTLPNGQRSLPAKKETISEEDAYLTGLIPIFRKLLDSGDLKLLAVCELQKLGLKFQFKNFFLQRSIRFLASNALIDKETLLAWEKSSMCIPGKVEALKVTRERPTE